MSSAVAERRRDVGSEVAQAKPMWELLPYEGLEAVVRVLTKCEGAVGGKHETGKWQSISARQHWASAMRHMVKWIRGEEIDPETQESHLAHAASRLLFILEHAERRKDCIDGVKGRAHA